MKRKNFITLILAVLMVLTCFGCKDEEETSNPETTVADETFYQISIDNMINGEVTTNLETAKSGDTVELTVTPNLGYKLSTLKANDTEVSGSFTMPKQDVVIKAEFKPDGEDMDVAATNLEIKAKNAGVEGKAHFTTAFGEEALVVKAVVEDKSLFLRDVFEQGDGIAILFSKRQKDTGYIADVTTKYQVNAKGEEAFLAYDGTKFVASNVAITSNFKYFTAAGKLAGYAIEVSIPYAALNVTKENAKEQLTMCPVLYNVNSKAGLGASAGVSQTHFCDLLNANTFIYVTDDNTYEVNEYIYDTYQVRVQESDGESHWDLEKDYFPSDAEYANRVVKLNETNGIENRLTFFKHNETTLYVEAEFLLTDIFGAETLGKFGFRFVDSNGDGFAFFADTDGTNVAGMTKPKNVGYTKILGNEFLWGANHVTIGANYRPAENQKIKLAVYREGNVFSLYMNEYHLTTLTSPGGISASDKIYPQIFSFNLGIEVSNYLATTDIPTLPTLKNQGHIFRDVAEGLKNSYVWDVSGDTETESNPVYLNAHDNLDNRLYFNVSSTEFMYAKATMKITDYLNKGDAWLKTGLAFIDGEYISSAAQYMFCMDAATQNPFYASTTMDIVLDTYVVGVRGLGPDSWTEYTNYHFDLGTLTAKLELFYYNNTIYFFADGNLITTINYTPRTDSLHMGIVNFGLGLELTDYYCTTNPNDEKIDSSIGVDGKALFAFLGSSVTYGSATNGSSFVELIDQNMDCAVIKRAISGTTLVTSQANSYVERLKTQIPASAEIDHLVVQLSTNDATQNRPLGAVAASGVTSYDTTTIIGAMEEIISYAKETWNCDVTFYTNPYYNNATYEAMIDALYEVKAKWGIGVLDFYNYENMEELSSTTLSSYMADAIHPNANGYAWMAGIFETYLRNAYVAKNPGETI